MSIEVRRRDGRFSRKAIRPAVQGSGRVISSAWLPGAGLTKVGMVLLLAGLHEGAVHAFEADMLTLSALLHEPRGFVYWVGVLTVLVKKLSWLLHLRRVLGSCAIRAVGRGTPGKSPGAGSSGGVPRLHGREIADAGTPSDNGSNVQWSSGERFS